MSIDDRLSFGEGPLGGPPPEVEPEEAVEERRPNRVFIFIAIAMGGLILLGVLLLVAALVFWLPRQRAAQIASVTKTVDAMTLEAASWTPTFTPSPTTGPATGTPTPLPTRTPIPTPTATRVVSTQEPEGLATPTATAGWGADTDTPSAGLSVAGTAAIAVGLAGLMFATRKLRSLR